MTDPKDLAQHARQMAATAKCLEVMAPFNTDERRAIVIGLMLACLDDNRPGDHKVINEILDRMAQKVAR